MKATLKPLGLAAAVAAVTAGYSGVSQAQAVLANNSLGDTAIIPYYTVAGNFVTGVHVINTDPVNTQVVKLRLRRGSDSMDALDFNLILSPNDEWTGFIDDSSGQVVFATEDNSCTAPLRADGRFPMPGLYEEGAEEGYIEVMGMAAAPKGSAIAAGALHGPDGVPADCQAVESNFFRVATDAAVSWPAGTVGAAGDNGVYASDLTGQTCTDAIALGIQAISFGTTCASNGYEILRNDYAQTDNVLKVSFFHRDATSGLEFGNSAVHLADFSNEAMMSNQEVFVQDDLDEFGYFFPDLNGGSPVDNSRSRFTSVRAALGASAVINDWSVAAARNVSTDWVVTLPGQYTMLDLQQYTNSLFDADEDCLTVEQAEADEDLDPDNFKFYCDERDLPVELTIRVWDREEQTFSTPDSGLVISPATTTTPGSDILENEVNVLQWTDGSIEPVLESIYAKKYDVSALGAENGWAKLSVEAPDNKTQGIYNWSDSITAEYAVFDSLANINIPIVGFVAWERSFPSDPSANYGRIVEHSYESGTPN